MELINLPHSDLAALYAARVVAGAAREAVAKRGRFVAAFSGGHTPGPMFDYLSRENLPWQQIHVFQVDERLAESGSGDRNVDALRRALVDQAALPADQLHALPVEARDAEAAMQGYARRLEAVAGKPAVIDLVHLGLGDDGHCASLVPGDPVLEVRNTDLALTQPYRGYRRMTLTLPALSRARCLLWLVTGAGKEAAIQRLVEGDENIPAGRLPRVGAHLVLDEAGTRAAQVRHIGKVDRHTSKMLLAAVIGSELHCAVESKMAEQELAAASDPGTLAATLKKITASWSFGAVGLGVPAPLDPGHTPDTFWTGFDWGRELGRPVRIAGAATLQALGSYCGGRMLFVSLDGVPECASVTLDGLEPVPLDNWRNRPAFSPARLADATGADYLMLGGAAAAVPPPDYATAVRAHPLNALAGALRFWRRDSRAAE